MLRSINLSLALASMLVSAGASAQPHYKIDLKVTEHAPWYALFSKDQLLVSGTLRADLGAPAPFISTSRMSYPDDVVADFASATPTIDVALEPVITGLDSLVTAKPANDGSDKILVSLMFSYTPMIESLAPTTEVHSVHQSSNYVVSPGSTQTIPFTVDSVDYSMSVTVTPFDLQANEINPN